MRRRVTVFALLSALALVAPVRAGVPAINAEGTFSDGAAWIYQAQQGFGFGPLIKGTNENLNVLPPNIPAGATPTAVELLRHTMDFHGYPLRISLIDKLFAIKEKVEVMSSMDGERREYDPGTPASQEKVLDGDGTGEYSVTGPIPAAGAIPAQYAKAFAYAAGALKQLNLPDEQKALDRYAVMFVDTRDVTWMEFAPTWGAGETPHLGCQTELGRDMVFGYEKRPPNDLSGGPFLQCM